MGGHNNQPKLGVNVGEGVGEHAVVFDPIRRSLAIDDDDDDDFVRPSLESDNEYDNDDDDDNNDDDDDDDNESTMLVVGASGSTVLRSLSGLIDVGWHPSTMGVLTF